MKQPLEYPKRFDDGISSRMSLGDVNDVHGGKERIEI